MQVQRVQNNNNRTTFGEKLIFDKKLISRATKEEKTEFVYLKNLFKSRGSDGKIEIKNNAESKIIREALIFIEISFFIKDHHQDCRCSRNEDGTRMGYRENHLIHQEPRARRNPGRAQLPVLSIHPSENKKQYLYLQPE